MKCPFCASEKSKVYDTRPFGEETYRRRLCSGCGKKFITFERAQEADETKTSVRKRRLPEYSINSIDSSKDSLRTFRKRKELKE